MVNMGQIHRELGKFLMFSSNFMKEDLKTIPWNQYSMNLTLISWRN